MILIRVRCKTCRGVLADVEHRPESWVGALSFLMCGKCERPDPRRVVDVMLAKNLDALPIAREIAWAALRPEIESAERRGRTVDVVT